MTKIEPQRDSRGGGPAQPSIGWFGCQKGSGHASRAVARVSSRL